MSNYLRTLYFEILVMIFIFVINSVINSTQIKSASKLMVFIRFVC